MAVCIRGNRAGPVRLQEIAPQGRWGDLPPRLVILRAIHALDSVGASLLATCHALNREKARAQITITAGERFPPARVFHHHGTAERSEGFLQTGLTTDSTDWRGSRNSTRITQSETRIPRIFTNLRSLSVDVSPLRKNQCIGSRFQTGRLLYKKQTSNSSAWKRPATRRASFSRP